MTRTPRPPRRRDRWFAVRQIVIAIGAAFAYFGVRGLTEGAVEIADRNAQAIIDIERVLGLDLELGLQELVGVSTVLVTLMNWTYIWLHWPLLIGTLAWLLRTDRDDYLRLRNAMMVSGAIGLVIFATLPVTPPRLFHADYFDTVTEYSYSYRVLQPPMFMDRYAALPSLHFGWNLLAGIAWARRCRRRAGRCAAVLMPAAMGLAVVATANHWVLDVVAGGAVAMVGYVVSAWWTPRSIARRASAIDESATEVPATAAVGGPGRDAGSDGWSSLHGRSTTIPSPPVPTRAGDTMPLGRPPPT